MATRTIMPLTPHHSEAVLGLFAEIFGATKAGYLRQRFDWQYRSCPALDAEQVSNWVFLVDDRVVGHLGAVMVGLEVDGSCIQGCWCTDLMVHPDFRQGKSFLKLISTLDEAAVAPMGYGMADVVGRTYERRGYVRHAIGSHLIRFTSLKGALNLADRGAAIDQTTSRLKSSLAWKIRNFRRFFRHRTTPQATAIEGWQAELSVKPPADMDELWRAVSGCYPVAVSRSGAQLQWRYCDGMAPARFLALYHAEKLQCVAVLEAFMWSGIRVGQISDLIIDRGLVQNQLPIVVQFISDVFERQPVDGILCEGFPSDIRKQFERQGFAEVIPGRSEIHVILNRNEQLPREIIEPADNWLLTAGDSDRSTPYPRLEWQV